MFIDKYRSLDNHKHSDLTVKVGTATFKVHKVILAAHTKLFTKATQNGRFLASKDNDVSIEEHSEHAVWRMLQYCYTGKYSKECNDVLNKGWTSLTRLWQ